MASMSPVIPAVASRNPAATGSRCFIPSCAVKGVSEASCLSIGPAVPFSETVPSPGRRAEAVKGKVEDTLPARAPQQVSLLRLDTDWYESTRHELKHLYPKVVSGGVVIIDDYGYFRGARKAVDEYFNASQRKIHLQRIDFTCRAGVKP